MCQYAPGAVYAGAGNPGATLHGGMTMIRDEAIEEIRERRRKLLKEEYGGSIDRFFDAAEEWQKKHPERIVHPHRHIELRKAS
jgi:hypothetical protein